MDEKKPQHQEPMIDRRQFLQTSITIIGTVSLLSIGVFNGNGSAASEELGLLTGGYGGGSVVCALAINPTTPATIYAGTSIGVYKSTNSGSAWKAVNSGLKTNSRYTRALVINPASPATVYAGTSAGVYKTTDSGSSWKAVNSGLSYKTILALAINPEAPQTLYAATRSGGIYKTTNGGSKWKAINSGLTYQNATQWALAIDPKTPSTIYAAGYPDGSVHGGS